MGSIHPTKKRYYSKYTRIDPEQSYQVAYWKQRFGISEQELMEAVRAVGGLARNVEAYLRQKGPRSFTRTTMVKQKTQEPQPNPFWFWGLQAHGDEGWEGTFYGTS